MKTSLPSDERARLKALYNYRVLDTPPEKEFDDITRLAAYICETPIALITLVDLKRQWFKSSVGLDAPETSRDVSFCAHAIMESDDVFIIPDTLADERFRTNPLVVSDPKIRFYAGAPLVTPKGLALGTLCVIDHVPRRLSEEQVDALRALSRQVVAQLELRRNLSELACAMAKRKKAEKALRRSERELNDFFGNGAVGLHWVGPDGYILRVNKAELELLGYAPEEYVGHHIAEFHTDKNVIDDILQRLTRGETLHNYEARLRCKDGSIKYVLINSNVLWENGRFIRTRCFTRDITERKRVEEILRKRTKQVIRHQSALLELAKMDNSDLDSTIKKITEADSKTLDVDRVSVWLFNDDRSEIICKDLYKMNENSHENGLRLEAKRYPRYFQALEESRNIAASDARTDPNTSEFTEEYLKPLGITSMMDVPIRLHGNVIGIVCHEHTGPIREWTLEEGDFAASIADMASLALEASERRRASEALSESLAQLAKKNRYQAIIGTITRSVHQSIKLQDVLENAVEAMNRNIDGAEMVSIFLVEGNEMVLKAHRGFPQWFTERRIQYPKGMTWKTITEGKPMYVANVEKDVVVDPAGRELGTKSYLSIPICFGDKTIGVININSLEKDAFSEEELNLLEIVARQIEVAINNAHQAEALRKAKNELEIKVMERTAELRNAYESLQIELGERKRAEEALRQSEERYRTLFNQSPVGVYIFDKEFKIIQCNERMVQILRSSYDKIVGLDMKRLKDQGFILAMVRALEGGSCHEERFYKATNSSAELWLSLNLSPLRDADGNVTRGMAVVEDITERKQTEGLLRESEQRHRALVENIYDLVCEISPNARYLYLSPNHRELLGYEPGELLGRSALEFIHPDDLSDVMERLRKGMEVGSQNAVFRYRHKDGQWRWFESMGKLFQTASGEIRVVVVSRDITDRKRMEEELLKAQKLESIGILAGGIAHDFNNLLTSILGNVSIIKMYSNPQDKIYERSIETEKACLRAKDLTQQLLTFSKGGVPIKKVISIGELIRDSVGFAVSGSDMRCEFSISEYLWPIEVDEGQINQVINNLVINADQSMPGGGVIRVRAENLTVRDSTADNRGILPLSFKDVRYVRITIEDEGTGIPQEHLTKIFDPYFTTKQKGSGLGLTTAYSIIKNHNGFIDVESQLGKGTKFYIYIPALDKEIIEETHINEKPIMGMGRVLIMDDEEMIREVTGEMLSHMGYEVEYASDGEEAIEQYTRAREENRPFDAVIMDLTIPGGMGGKEAIERLINIDPEIRAIVSSGYSNDSIMSEFKKYGFRGVISKPYNAQELAQALKTIIG